MISDTSLNAPRKKSIGLIFMGGCVLVVFVYLALADSTLMGDFMGLYFPARALLHHSDPYNSSAVLNEYESQGPNCLTNVLDCTTAIHFPHPPTEFAITSIFATLPLMSARFGWEIASASALLLSCFLIWDVGADFDAEVSGYLLAFHLANSQFLILSGNSACLAIGLCTIALWCILKEKHGILAVALLAVSLTLKPQIGGLVWLYLVFAERTWRKRALQALGVCVALGGVSVIWVSCVAPKWWGEMTNNLDYFMSVGGINDPGPTSSSRAGWIIDLQSAVSLVWNQPSIYNLSTYLICGAIIFPLAVFTFRARILSSRNAWFAIAAISALTMLVAYHRRYDSRLLLMAVPACAMLWSEGGHIGRWALGVTGSCMAFTGDCLWIFTTKLVDKLQGGHDHLYRILESLLITLPAPLSLLTMAVFYLWVFMKRTQMSTETDKRQLTPEATI